MKQILALTALLIASHTFAQTKLPETKCAAYARGIMKSVFRMDTKGIFQLVSVKNLKEYNDAAAENQDVEELLYMSEGATVTIKSFPDYYEKGRCELRSIEIGRE